MKNKSVNQPDANKRSVTRSASKQQPLSKEEEMAAKINKKQSSNNLNMSPSTKKNEQASKEKKEPKIKILQDIKIVTHQAPNPSSTTKDTSQSKIKKKSTNHPDGKKGSVTRSNSKNQPSPNKKEKMATKIKNLSSNSMNLSSPTKNNKRDCNEKKEPNMTIVSKVEPLQAQSVPPSTEILLAFRTNNQVHKKRKQKRDHALKPSIIRASNAKKEIILLKKPRPASKTNKPVVADSESPQDLLFKNMPPLIDVLPAQISNHHKQAPTSKDSVISKTKEIPENMPLLTDVLPAQVSNDDKQQTATSKDSVISKTKKVSKNMPLLTDVLPAQVSNDNSRASTSKDPAISKTKKVPAILKMQNPVNMNKLSDKPNPKTITKQNTKEDAPKLNKNSNTLKRNNNKTPVPKVHNKQALREKEPKRRSSDMPSTKTEKKHVNMKKDDKPRTYTRRKRIESANLRVENVYIAEGLREDCENLIEKCLQVYKLNFEKFCDIWKKMKFASIFHNRQSSAELAELSEEALHIAKEYMLTKTINFEENVAGLFLVYAFLNLQPYEGFAVLRLVPDDVPLIKELDMEARKQRRFDIIYILGNVLIRGSHCHIAQREVALELPIRKYFDGSTHMAEPRQVLTKNSEVVCILKNLFTQDQKYKNLKERLKKIKDFREDRICYTNQPSLKLFESYRRNIPGDVVCDPDTENELDKMKSPSPDEDRHDKVQSIKERAMAMVVDPMRHLSGVQERKHSKSLTPPSSASPTKMSESEAITKSPRSRGKGKGKGKGKGRASAKTLHELFKDATEEIAVRDKNLNPEWSQKDLPPIDVTDDLMHITNSLPVSKIKSTVSARFNAIPDQKRQYISESDSYSHTEDEEIPCNEVGSNKSDSKKQLAKSKGLKVQKLDKKAVKRKKKPKPKSVIETNSDADDVHGVSLGEIENEDSVIEAKLDNVNEPHNQILDKIKLNSDKTKCNNENMKVIKNVEGASDSVSVQTIRDEELVVELNSIPNQNIEIEIIDHFKGAAETSAENETIKDTVVVSEKDINSKNTNRSRSLKRKRSTSKSIINGESINSQTTEQIETRSKRKEKRELKRMRIKSKFSKLGILEVANFDSEGESSSKD